MTEITIVVRSSPLFLMPRQLLKTALACAGIGLGFAGSAAAAPTPAHVSGELVVGYEDGRTAVTDVPPDAPVERVAERVATERGVEYAVPNYVASASTVEPYDVGTSLVPRGWEADQWSFLQPPGGVRIPGAWNRLNEAGKPGGAGVTVAVVDTGIAYAPTVEGGGAAPDFGGNQFVPGVDLVDDDDRPLDENGHGTHIAATIGEQISLTRPQGANDYLTGIAYGAKLMPVRVLDGSGAGAASDVGAGILWAAKHGADVINLSLQFDPAISSCEDVPSVCVATKRATRKGALVVAAGGNALQGLGDPGALFPGAAPGALGVGATTEHGCIAEYSHFGKGVEMVAPGGGAPRSDNTRTECVGDLRPILSLTLECFPGTCGLGLYGDFGIRADTGTSMASAHVAGVAALVIAAGTAGKDPTPRQLARRLRCTARTEAPRRLYGAGQLDALRAVQARYRCK